MAKYPKALLPLWVVNRVRLIIKKVIVYARKRDSSATL